MKGRSKKKRARTAKKKTVIPPLDPPLDQMETGMPALDSITGVDEFKKGKKVFRIIHTNEVDEYEQPSKAKRKKR